MSRNIPSQEEFDDWRGSPVAEWFFQQILDQVDGAKKRWADISFDGGQADPLILHSLRERAAAYQSVVEAEYQGLVPEEDHEEPIGDYPN